MMYPKRAARRGGGFTLIEFIGVLAIIAILAAMIVPSVIDQMYRAAGGAEEGNLAAIAEGIRLSAQNTNPKEIPGTTVTACGGGNFQEWICAASAQVNIGPAQINTNRQNLQRYYVWDNGGAPAIPAGGYVQTSAGTAGAITQRIMILASVGSPIGGVASGAMPTANFNTIWNWDGQSQSAAVAAVVGIPAARLPGDFRVERIHLAPLFHNLVLSSGATAATQPQYNIDGAAPLQVPAGGVNAGFIHGTAMGLYDETGALLSSKLLNDSVSFTYPYGRLYGNPTVSGAPAVGDTTMTLVGAPLTGQTATGDTFTVAGAGGPYTVTNNSTAAGNSITILFTPGLTAAPAPGAAVVFVFTPRVWTSP